MSYLAVTDMAADDRPGARALVGAVAPMLAESRWTELVRRGPPAGALVLRGPEGSVFGFASYRPEREEDGTAILVVDNFVTAELSRRGRGRELLAAALKDRAGTLGCAGVRQAGGQPGVLRNALALSGAG